MRDCVVAGPTLRVSDCDPLYRQRTLYTASQKTSQNYFRRNHFKCETVAIRGDLPRQSVLAFCFPHYIVCCVVVFLFKLDTCDVISHQFCQVNFNWHGFSILFFLTAHILPPFYLVMPHSFHYSGKNPQHRWTETTSDSWAPKLHVTAQKTACLRAWMPQGRHFEYSLLCLLCVLFFDYLY